MRISSDSAQLRWFDRSLKERENHCQKKKAYVVRQEKKGDGHPSTLGRRNTPKAETTTTGIEQEECDSLVESLEDKPPDLT